jgi:hypothetical protein
VKRLEVLGFLKEVLRVCGESILIEMAWLRKITQASNCEDENYQLVIRAILKEEDLKCVRPIAAKFGMEMKQHGEIWIFSKNMSSPENFSASTCSV